MPAHALSTNAAMNARTLLLADLMHMACFFMISLVLGMAFGIEGCTGLACRPIIIPIVLPVALCVGTFMTYMVEQPCAKLFRPAKKEKPARTAELAAAGEDGTVL